MSEAPTLALREPPAHSGAVVPTLELESVTIVYGSDPPVPALQGVSFSVHAGELSRSSARPALESRRCCI